MLRTTIFDQVLSIDDLEVFEKHLEKAWDENMPILAERFGLDTLQAAGYRITLEVIVDAE